MQPCACRYNAIQLMTSSLVTKGFICDFNYIKLSQNVSNYFLLMIGDHFFLVTGLFGAPLRLAVASVISSRPKFVQCEMMFLINPASYGPVKMQMAEVRCVYVLVIGRSPNLKGRERAHNQDRRDFLDPVAPHSRIFLCATYSYMNLVLLYNSTRCEVFTNFHNMASKQSHLSYRPMVARANASNCLQSASQRQQQIIITSRRQANGRLTALGSSFACHDESGFNTHVRGIRITPSIMACATCTPCGPNSSASDSARARSECFDTLKGCIHALALTPAVAPVNMRVGTRPSPVALRRRGSVSLAKRKAPFLVGRVSGRNCAVGREVVVFLLTV